VEDKMKRNASAQWQGDLKTGKGTVSTESGVLTHTPYSFSTRFESGKGTNPEELIAAAHAACFSMAFSNGLAQAGHAPEQLNTSATVTFQPGEGITKVVLDVVGRVPGMDSSEFEQAAEQAKENCPVSKALAAVPEIGLSARLES
jgi:osmotically inducible protein OsmC